MQQLWTGAWPSNRAPAIQSLGIQGAADPRAVYLHSSQDCRAEVSAVDPDGDALSLAWDIRPEVVIPPGSYAGGLEKRVEPISGLISNPTADTIDFTTPENPGAYRLFVTITDGQDHIAYGKIPFFVSD